MAVIIQPMDEHEQAKILDLVAPKSELFRLVVLDVIARIAVRIHTDGKASDGSKIGTYSEAYMKVRTGSFASSPKITKGANKGKTKGPGTVSKGANKGAKRTSYNRTNDTSVVISLTRQLENDYAVVGGDKGWGVGFKNPHNFDKATWNNERYEKLNGKIIYDLTSEELEAVELLTAQLINEMQK